MGSRLRCETKKVDMITQSIDMTAVELGLLTREKTKVREMSLNP